jgi:hypothetical protein
MLVMVLPGHAGDGTIGATWLQGNVEAESCWRRHYQGDLTTA